MHNHLFDNAPEAAHPFLINCITELERHGVNLIISGEEQVKFDSVYSSGFFEDKPLTFAVATGKPFDKWFAIFVHEYNHFKQWQENPDVFSQLNKDITELFKWVSHEIELEPTLVNKYAKEALWIEWDCEKRSVDNIKKNGLEQFLDLPTYIMGANAYFNFYHVVESERQWYKKGQEPYTLEHVYHLFPSDKITSLETLTEEQKAAYLDCFKEIDNKKKLSI